MGGLGRASDVREVGLLITKVCLPLLFNVCAARAVYFHDVSPRKSLGWARRRPPAERLDAKIRPGRSRHDMHATINDGPSSMHRFYPLSTRLLKRRLAMPLHSAQVQHTISRSSSSASSSSDLSFPSSTTVEQSSPAPPPLLMLEGDRFELSVDGISRTAYRLKNPDANGLLVEELYNINKATKKFILRRSDANHQYAHDTYTSRSTPNAPSPSIDLGLAYQTIELQELEATKVDAVGTGAMSWESSVAMSLFFSYNPHLLSGHILELGSGCGHGGILVLSQLLSNESGRGAYWPLVDEHSRSYNPSIEGFVFTDYQNEILDQCARNVHSVFSQNNIPSQVHFQTKILNWNFFSVEDETSPSDLPQYKTILASDCAFRCCDIEPLSETIVRLLSIRPGSCFHTFGPINRAALHSLIDSLRAKGMCVGVETLEMERLRLMPSRSGNVCLEKRARQASAGMAKILHVTARERDTEDNNSDDICDLD